MLQILAKDAPELLEFCQDFDEKACGAVMGERLSCSAVG